LIRSGGGNEPVWPALEPLPLQGEIKGPPILQNGKIGDRHSEKERGDKQPALTTTVGPQGGAILKLRKVREKGRSHNSLLITWERIGVRQVEASGEKAQDPKHENDKRKKMWGKPKGTDWVREAA